MSNMYNEALKNEYLSERVFENVNIYDNLFTTFHNSLKMETKLNKDISCFTVSEIIEFYKSLCSTSTLSLNVINGQLKIYTEYCLAKNLVPDYQNHFCEIGLQTLHSCINLGLISQCILNREDVIHMCKDLLNVSDRVLLLALFEGICGNKSVELKFLHPSKINKDNIIKLYTGRELKISQELSDLIAESCEQYEYYSYAMDGSGEGKTLKYNMEDIYAIKDLPQSNNSEYSEPRIRKRIYSKLCRIAAFLDDSQAICIPYLRESGRIELINKRLAEGHELNEIIFGKELTDRYGRISWKAAYMQKYGDYING